MACEDARSPGGVGGGLCTLAADRGWPVGREYIDNGVSAFSGKQRQQYVRMLADLNRALVMR
jgi:DNA invertase Pin-like site-specific DNA recombinase